MIRFRSPGRFARRGAGAALSVSLIAALVLQGGPVAGAAATCPSPPSVYPESSLNRGDTAVGHTVIQGTSQTDFDVTILGIQPNGIAPGLDFILAQITGPASFLDETGGIVAGMSGSPVDIGSQLVGSTSYGFFGADQTIMGITPAQPMVDLFSYPDTPGSALASRSLPRMASRVPLTSELQARAASATGSSAADFSTARQLPMPLAVSGLNGRAMARFNRVLNRFDVPVVAYRAASAPVAAVPVTPLAAGDSLASGLSYGDFSVAAVGTATATCGDLVVGYGHPLTFSGGINVGMNSADVLKVIKDPSQIFGGFKMANVTGLHGTVTQDRLAGIRGTEGVRPLFARIKAHIQNLDIGNKVRDGETDIIRDLKLGPFFIDLPYIAAFALLSEEDVAFDRVGDGSSSLHWVITGKAPDGSRFVFGRADKFYSEYDATFESIFELYGELRKLLHSGFGHATISRVRVDGSITQDQLTTKIGRVLSSSSVQPSLQNRNTLRVRPGDTIHLRVFMRNHGADSSFPVNMDLRVPARFRGGEVFVRPGRGSGGYFSFGGQRVKATSFADLVHKLAHGEHNYDLIAELIGSAGGNEGVVSPSPAPTMRTTRIDRKVTSARTRVVLGRKFLRIVVR
jgi:hypothetical protein